MTEDNVVLAIRLAIVVFAYVLGYPVFWFMERKLPDTFCLKGYKYVLPILVGGTLIEYFYKIPSFVASFGLTAVSLPFIYFYIKWKQRHQQRGR